MPIDISRVNLNNLDPDEKAVFMWQYGYHDDPFWLAFWECLKNADDDNIGRIGYGFPIEVQGLMKYRTVPNWWQEVERKAVLQVEEIDAT